MKDTLPASRDTAPPPKSPPSAPGCVPHTQVHTIVRRILVGNAAILFRAADHLAQALLALFQTLLETLQLLLFHCFR